MYDGECPFCNNYVHFVNLREIFGEIRLIDARDDTPERKEVEERGYDLDEGMIVFYEGEYYHGHDAMHIIGTLADGKGIIHSFNKWVFSSPNRAKHLYPTLRFFRNGALKLLGRKKINA
ncbi:MAG: DCC1-like thiol-disulfide oxidoreductase family protein [Bdellovibrionales bacterium]